MDTWWDLDEKEKILRRIFGTKVELWTGFPDVSHTDVWVKVYKKGQCIADFEEPLKDFPSDHMITQIAMVAG